MELFYILTQKLSKSSENGFSTPALTGLCIHMDVHIRVPLLAQKESLRISKFEIWGLRSNVSNQKVDCVGSNQQGAI